jgi:hypothetical protein
VKENQKGFLNGVARAFDFSWPRAVCAHTPASSHYHEHSDGLDDDQCLLAEEYLVVYAEPADLSVILSIHVPQQSKNALHRYEKSMRKKLWGGSWGLQYDCGWNFDGQEKALLKSRIAPGIVCDAK